MKSLFYRKQQEEMNGIMFFKGEPNREYSEEEFLNKRIHQFLVHSFLYYKLDASIISDDLYDKICLDIVELKKTVDYQNHKYVAYIEELDTSGSGFYLSKYPPNVISTAFHLLYNKTENNESFEQFIGRWGYKK